jgi:hypothetical protein
MLFGMETEMAYFGPSRLDDLRFFVQAAKQTLTHLPGGSASDLYLENGARLYIDSGGHPEMTTPECTTPTQVVRYKVAGERILADVLKAQKAERMGRKPALFTSNVDYSGSRATWGSHESYLYRCDPGRMPEHIIPYLVSRVIFTGAGGFNPFSRGLEFTLSPRSLHIHHPVTGDSTGERGIYHAKDETLSGTGTHRLHLICGESLCSHIGTWLRIGATALVVALIDAGVNLGDGVQFTTPVEALHTFAGDDTLQARAPLCDGREFRAIDVQRHYLAQVEEYIGTTLLPDWAEDVYKRWCGILDRLESDPQSLETTLDWPLKRTLYAERARRRGIKWSDLRAWSHILSTINAALAACETKGKKTVEIVLSKESPIPDTVKSLTPYLQEHLLDWDSLRPFVDLRQELFEVEMRFGQIGDAGIFTALDRQGLLDHSAPGVGRIDAAKTNPPTTTRAHVRGRAIRRYSDRTGYRVAWDGIWDINGKRRMDLSNPFERTVKWREFSRTRKLIEDFI